MMREILFRGKRRDNRKWAIGSLIVTRYRNVEGYGDFDRGAIAVAEDEKRPWHTAIYDVLEETVGQFTGLTDKNGKKIFEGDIVRYEEEGFVSGVYEVAWAKGNCEFVLCNDQVGFGIAYAHPYLEVIGNIHDNPELIGGGEDG